MQNCSLGLVIEDFEQGGVQAAGKLWRNLSHGKIAAEDGERIVAVLGDLRGITQSLFRKYMPDPDSRVTLTTERAA